MLGGGGGGASAPAPSPSPSPAQEVSLSALTYNGPAISLSGNSSSPGNVMPSNTSLSFSSTANSGIFANPLTNLPSMRFKMGSQNSALFPKGNGIGGNRGGNGGGGGGINGGGGVGGY